MVCTSCGHCGAPKLQTRGSMAIEVVLWLCFLVPGLIYSLWRLSPRRKVCQACEAPSLVPPTSTVGAMLVREQGQALAEPAAPCSRR